MSYQVAHTPGAGHVHAAGVIYVVDGNNLRIQKFAGGGTYLTQWGSYGTGDGEFSYPWGVAVDDSETVYVSELLNHRIQKFDGYGTFLSKWGANGSTDGLFESPEGVAIDAMGNILVADAGNDRIQGFGGPWLDFFIGAPEPPSTR